MERFLIEWSIRAVLLAVGTGIVVTILRVRGASLLHRAWTAAMVAMLLLPVWTKWGPSVSAPILPAVGERTTRVEMPLATLALPGAEIPQAETAGEPVRSVPRPALPDWQEILSAVYLAGIAVMLARLVMGMLEARSMMRSARQAEGFVTSPQCAAPVTIGWLRPVLLLPDGWRSWPSAKLDAVLIHEREHVRRRDPVVQRLALLNRCIFWFHPLAWWLERKLSALAEEACDTAVLAGGHAPHDYARYLIEMARSVNAAGARLRWAGAVEFSAGQLARRIRRIMDAPRAAAMSRAKSIASMSLCVLMLATFLACSVGRRTSSSANHPARSEQERGERARQFSDDAVRKAALDLTADGAKELEAYVKEHPNQPDQMREMVEYYESKKDWKALDALTLWFVAEHPGMRLNWAARPEWDRVWDQDGFERGRQLWTEQLKKSWESPYVYMNAAEFLSGNDNEQAEQVLLEGQRRFPASGRWSGLHWEVFLARHYAWALTGSAGQLPERETADLIDYSSAPAVEGAYAQKVRATLLASKDAELLTRTAEQLQLNRPNMEFSRSLIERALSIDPDNRSAHIQRDEFQTNAVKSRAKEPGSLSDADRILLIESLLTRGFLVCTDATKAHELLALASHNTEDPNYGTAVFLGNLALGEAALNRGDKAGAVRYLLAASEAQPTEFLHYHKLDMSLAKSLVEAGEREGVATFLSNCAKFNNENKLHAEWAVQIRQGLDPQLTPNSFPFSNATNRTGCSVYR